MCEKEGANEIVDRLLIDSYILGNDRRSKTTLVQSEVSQRKEKRKGGHLSTFWQAMVRFALFADMSFPSPRRVAIVT